MSRVANRHARDSRIVPRSRYPLFRPARLVRASDCQKLQLREARSIRGGFWVGTTDRRRGDHRVKLARFRSVFSTFSEFLFVPFVRYSRDIAGGRVRRHGRASRRGNFYAAPSRCFSRRDVKVRARPTCRLCRTIVINLTARADTAPA